MWQTTMSEVEAQEETSLTPSFFGPLLKSEEVRGSFPREMCKKSRGAHGAQEQAPGSVSPSADFNELRKKSMNLLPGASMTTEHKVTQKAKIHL